MSVCESGDKKPRDYPHAHTSNSVSRKRQSANHTTIPNSLCLYLPAPPIRSQLLIQRKKIKLKSEKHNVERRRQKKKPKRKKAIAHFSSYRFHGFFFFYKIKSQIRAHWHNTAYTHWLDGNKQRQIDGMRKKNIITRNLGSHCVFSHEQQQNTAHYFFFKFLFFQIVSV